MGRGARRPRQRRPAERYERRDRFLQHRPHRGDHRDARPGQVLRCLLGCGDERPGLADGPGLRRPSHQPRARGVPPARRPVRQARPALRDRPALPPGGPTGLLAYDEPAGGLRGCCRAASSSGSLGHAATDRALVEGGRHRMKALLGDFSTEVRRRLDDLDQEVRAGGLEPAIDLIVSSLRRGGVLQAFGTGHSQAFAMEIAGRAGGLIPTHAIVLRDVVLRGSRDVSVLQGAALERDESVADELFELYSFDPADVFLIASNSGVNGSIVGVALRAKSDGHPVIAVTSLEHTSAVTPKHSSGKRLSEIADIVIDNRAPYGDATIGLGDGLSAGAVSSITAAYIAQLLPLGTAQRLRDAGEVPPLYISANIPGGDEHNDALKARYGERIASLT